MLRADWPYEAEEFAIVDGAMDALDLVTRSLIGFGDRVIVENPTFPLLLDLIEATGADVIGVPVDDEGLIPAALAEALQTAATAVILQPRAQNPTGASLGVVRAEELAKIVRASVSGSVSETRHTRGARCCRGTGHALVSDRRHNGVPPRGVDRPVRTTTGRASRWERQRLDASCARRWMRPRTT